MKGNFKKRSSVAARTGLTGYDTARNILDSNGLYDVHVEVVRGSLSDHYDPINRVVRLLEEVYYGSSIASVSVAAREVGHANLHKQSYSSLVIRDRLFPFEEHGVKKVLNAAALTYVAAALMTLFELIKFVMIFVHGSQSEEG